MFVIPAHAGIHGGRRQREWTPDRVGGDKLRGEGDKLGLRVLNWGIQVMAKYGHDLSDH